MNKVINIRKNKSIRISLCLFFLFTISINNCFSICGGRSDCVPGNHTNTGGFCTSPFNYCNDGATTPGTNDYYSYYSKCISISPPFTICCCKPKTCEDACRALPFPNMFSTGRDWSALNPCPPGVTKSFPSSIYGAVGGPDSQQMCCCSNADCGNGAGDANNPAGGCAGYSGPGTYQPPSMSCAPGEERAGSCCCPVSVNCAADCPIGGGPAPIIGNCPNGEYLNGVCCCMADCSNDAVTSICAGFDEDGYPAAGVPCNSGDDPRGPNGVCCCTGNGAPRPGGDLVCPI